MAMVDPKSQTPEAWEEMHQKYPQGNQQIIKRWEQSRAFKDDLEDMCFDDSDLAKIKANTLIVHGDKDPLFPVEIAQAIKKGIPQSDLWIIPDGGHVPIYPTLPKNFSLPQQIFCRQSLLP